MPRPAPGPADVAAIRWLTFLIFTMFAMTTDAVGVVIPAVIRQFGLSMTAAGGVHYATMTAIAVSGALLGHLADRYGRRDTILAGLAVYAVSAYLFAVSETFPGIVALAALSGAAIGVFKTGALALIGDISGSTREHTATMNTIEGFFGLGAIIGPALVTWLLAAGFGWTWLYLVAGTGCLGLMALAASIRYPVHAARRGTGPATAALRQTIALARDPHAMGFASGAVLYVAVEAAVYVWMPTLIAGYHGGLDWLAAYALTAFFALRAAGRFVGARLLARHSWTVVMVMASGGTFLCLAGTVVGGVAVAPFLLPLSGLFMSVVYPTLNSKGISCFPRARHGAVAGVLLFFTCVGAVAGPLAMALLGDWTGTPMAGFAFASVLAGLLFAGLLWNWIADPSRPRLQQLDMRDYAD